jgi:acrylyl-CoA reductase (NADPH)
MPTSETFNALVVAEINGIFERTIETKSFSDLPSGDVVVEVVYSSLNYKDALSASGNKGVTRHYPHTPGINAAGIVRSSTTTTFTKGDLVIVGGYGFGTAINGGFGQFVSVPTQCVIALPDGLSLLEAMTLGTGGFTAAQSLAKLIAFGLTPDQGPLLVTGATGGVGSATVSIAAHLGYHVVAATGKKTAHEFLKTLGAAEVLDRSEVDLPADRPMLKEKWAGCIDSVGGNILTTALRATKYGCSVTTCGLTQSSDITATVFPFILRGVNLLGIDSASLPLPQRKVIWDKLATEWKPPHLSLICTECDLSEINKYIDAILQGKITGRIVLKH